MRAVLVVVAFTVAAVAVASPTVKIGAIGDEAIKGARKFGEREPHVVGDSSPGHDGSPPVAPLIISGDEVDSVDKYPYFVRLSMGCGGSVIAPRLVMTAAHCVFPQGGDVTLFGGSLQATGPGYTQAPEGVTTYRAVATLVHPEYNGEEIRNDIALLILDQAVDFTTEFAVPSTIVPDPGTEVTLIGFGGIDPQATQSEFLLEATVQVITDEQCYLDPNTPEVICFDGLTENSTESSCMGDSGGPAILNSDPSQVIGVTSFGYVEFDDDGNPLCLPLEPVGYTQVSTYTESFIAPTMQSIAAQEQCPPESDGVVVQNDWYGDGWNGNVFIIQDCDGNIIETFEMENGVEQLDLGECIDMSSPFLAYFDTSFGDWFLEPSVKLVTGFLSPEPQVLAHVMTIDGVVDVNGGCPDDDVYPEIESPCLGSFWLYDSYGDGWQGAQLNVIDRCTGEVEQEILFEGMFTYSYSCYPYEGYQLELDLSNELFANEVMVVIQSEDGEITMLNQNNLYFDSGDDCPDPFCDDVCPANVENDECNFDCLFGCSSDTVPPPEFSDCEDLFEWDCPADEPQWSDACPEPSGFNDNGCYELYGFLLENVPEDAADITETPGCEDFEDWICFDDMAGCPATAGNGQCDFECMFRCRNGDGTEWELDSGDCSEFAYMDWICESTDDESSDDESDDGETYKDHEGVEGENCYYGVMLNEDGCETLHNSGLLDQPQFDEFEITDVPGCENYSQSGPIASFIQQAVEHIVCVFDTVGWFINLF